MTPTLPGADIRHYYAALGVALPTWASENASVRCFADPNAHNHGDRHASCSVHLTTGSFNCHGCGAHGGAYDAALELGHTPRSAIELMIRYELVNRRHTRPHRRAAPSSHQPPPRTERTAPPAFNVSEDDVARWRTSLGLRPLILQWLARRRAWSVSAIRAFELGIDGYRITIPVRNELRQLVGLLRYTPWPPGRLDKMHAAAGSHRQLLPHPTTEASSRVLLVEGEPDMLAARSLGLAAIAVPGVGCWQAGWGDLLVGRQITIVMDADTQGRAMVARIAQDLSGRAATETVDVAPNRDDGYDLTDWLMNDPSAALEALR
jgi:hypothetical protein